MTRSVPFMLYWSRNLAQESLDVNPLGLISHNLVLAGDSNDRNLFDHFCNALGAKPEVIERFYTPHDSPYGELLVGFSKISESRICHFRDLNASLLFLFHFGVMSNRPEPEWHAQCMKKFERSHLALLGNSTTPPYTMAIPATDLAKFVFPYAIQKHLPQRPTILVTQSSLWDSMWFKWTHPTVKDIPLSVLQSWDWRERAAAYLDAWRSSGVEFTRILWRTNPNCPFQDSAINSASESQREEVYRLQRDLALSFEIVDWRAQFQVHTASQCDGVHYTKEGYMFLIKIYMQVLLQPPGRAQLPKTSSQDKRSRVGADARPDTGDASAVSRGSQLFNVERTSDVHVDEAPLELHKAIGFVVPTSWISAGSPSCIYALYAALFGCLLCWHKCAHGRAHQTRESKLDVEPVAFGVVDESR